MPVDPGAVGTVSGPSEQSWTSKDCLLYALGVGAGSCSDSDEIAFTTENSEGVQQQVLPTMAAVLDTDVLETMKPVGDFDMSQVLHGEQRVEIHRPLPVRGRVVTTVEIIGLYDKGSGALVVNRSTSCDAATGEPMFTNTWSGFLRGEGGFGGPRDDGAPPVELPSTEPDAVLTYRTREDQGLLYRLSGDRHPLHSDPAYPARAGFPRPILHGLCTYGFTGRALLRTYCGGQAARFRSIQARFSAPVFPGEELTVGGSPSDGRAHFRTSATDGRVVLTAGVCEFAPS
jgi:acyl dehydratase